jgi:hypothetical protein
MDEQKLHELHGRWKLLHHANLSSHMPCEKNEKKSGREKSLAYAV